MALMTRLNATTDDQLPDITSNLPSLQFISALTNEERMLLDVRKRTHAITVSVCAHATFFVSILNEARQIKKQLRSPRRQASRIIFDLADKDPLNIGILGCGKIGAQLAQTLLTYGRVQPENLLISTRRPDTLDALKSKGVQCFYDNVRLASSVDVLFVCVLPAQIPLVAQEICPVISDSCFFYCISCGVKGKKLKQLFGLKNIIRPELNWLSEAPMPAWNNLLSVSLALEQKDLVERTCPIHLENEECPVTVDSKLAELFIFGLVNMCSHMATSRQHTLDMVHMVIFAENIPVADQLKEGDFVKDLGDASSTFPVFDLVRVSTTKTSLGKKLAINHHLRTAFRSRYWQVFDQYLQMKALGQVDT